VRTFCQVCEHEEGEGKVVNAFEGFAESFVVSSQTRKRAARAKLRSTTHRRGSSTKPRLAAVCLTTCN
jgi:hypothetical protein